jgi:excisionase family DNA binding protein
MTEKLLDANEVAELLSVPVGWVREHTRTGAIPHVALGRYVRYSETDVVAWGGVAEDGRRAGVQEAPTIDAATGGRRRYTMSTITLPDMIGWNARQPTVEECELVGRDVFYAEPLKGSGIGDCGGYVIETSANPDAQAKLTEAFELFGMCDPAHVIPAGVYLEE